MRKSTALGLDDLAAAALSQLAKAQTALGQSEDRDPLRSEFLDPNCSIPTLNCLTFVSWLRFDLIASGFAALQVFLCPIPNPECGQDAATSSAAAVERLRKAGSNADSKLAKLPDNLEILFNIFKDIDPA